MSRAASSGRSTRRWRSWRRSRPTHARPQPRAGVGPGPRPAARCRRARRRRGVDTRTRTRAGSAAGAGRGLPGPGQPTSGTSIRSASRRCLQRDRVGIRAQPRDAARRPSSRASSRARAASTPSAAASIGSCVERPGVAGGHDPRPAVGMLSAATTSMAVGMAEGRPSGRPCRPSRSSSRKPGRSGRGSLAPCEVIVGRMPSRRSARTHRKAGTLRRAQPLVAVAGVVRRAEVRRDRAGPCPGRGRRR